MPALRSSTQGFGFLRFTAVDYIDREENAKAQVLMGSVTLFGGHHHFVAIRVEGGIEPGTMQEAVCDPYDRLSEISALNDSWLEPVKLPGFEGDWVCCIFPYGRG